MTSSDVRLVAVPLIAAGVVSALAWSAALLAIRRNIKRQDRRQLAKPVPVQASRNDVTDAEIAQALTQLSIAIARHVNRGAFKNQPATRQSGS
ncbi:hypothetical protein [Rhodopseudomonas sp. RCAM05734]|uniref:hypothetical protein n=1 Tax=Rhodopseudomonas sp. RCAM05734 TaxID=3457549 RepID=UPI0040447434